MFPGSKETLQYTLLWWYQRCLSVGGLRRLGGDCTQLYASDGVVRRGIRAFSSEGRGQVCCIEEGATVVVGLGFYTMVLPLPR